MTWNRTRLSNRLGRLSAIVAVALLVGAPAVAQTWPTRPVTLVVGFAPAGGTDVLGRIIAKRLSEILGQQIIVENVGGAGGMVGSARVVKAAPDGYTIAMGTRADAINQTLYKRPLYDLNTDLLPGVLIADQPMVMIARPNIPAANLQELIAFVKKNQDTVKFASAGAGSTGHLDCVRFHTAIGVKVTHVPYRGGGPAMQDLIAGRVDYICTLSATAAPQILGKLVRPIAVFVPNRLPNLPDLPTAKEQGFAEVDASTWFGLMVPKGTPAPIIQRLREATVEAMNTPAVQEQLLRTGSLVVSPERRTTEYFRKYVLDEIERNAAPIRATGVSIE